eukprot:Clim_evm18s148 gene=Clim_evmTU18s148
MSVPEAQSRSVFVGNIPYDATESQLIEVFSEVGPVINFRLVTDRDTGKPKGYGFCEFRDRETAQSAIRNLNNYNFYGRALKVDNADRGSSSAGPPVHSQSSAGPSGALGGSLGAPPPPPGPPRSPRSYDATGRPDISSTGASGGPVGNTGTLAAAPLQAHYAQTASAAVAEATARSDLPTGSIVPPEHCIEAIQAAMLGMDPPELLQFLKQFKQFSQEKPEAARALLLQNPQLAYALLFVEVSLGLVDPSKLQGMIQSGISMEAQQGAASAAAASRAATASTAGAPLPHAASGVYQPSMPAHHHAPPPPPPSAAPPQSSSLLGKPSDAGPPPPPPGPPPGAAPSGQDELIQQVMSLTQAQIDQLPPAEREQIMMLRSQFGL